MSNIFISYHHQSVAIIKTLAEDIDALGHTVWFDHELSGGQAWWDQILAKVRDCDVFVFVLSLESLNSTACNREYSYAADLGKPILPILVSDEVSTNLLPPTLMKIQFVDYRKQDRDSALCLGKALTTVPPPEPLPEPLPDAPEVPISYLGTLTEQMEKKTGLSFEEQSAFVVDLKRSLRDPEFADDARTLLERLRKRRDLLATIAEEIDEVLTSTIKAPSAEAKPQEITNEKEVLPKNSTEPRKEPSRAKIIQPLTTPAVTRPTTTLWERLLCALFGAILGSAVGVPAMETITGANDNWVVGLLAGAGVAIAGAISGTDRRLIVAVLVGAALGWGIIALFMIGGEQGEGAFALGGIIGVPSGAVFGAILGVILRKLKKWPKAGRDGNLNPLIF